MSIAFSCDKCGRNLRLNPNLAGKRIKCPGCQIVLTVPAESDSQAAQEAPPPPPPTAPTPPAAPTPPVAPTPSARPTAANATSASTPALSPVPTPPARTVSRPAAAPSTQAATSPSTTNPPTAPAAAPTPPPQPVTVPAPPASPAAKTTSTPAPTRPTALAPAPPSPPIAKSPPAPPPSPPPELWHVKTEDDESYGPVDRAELNAWVAEGRLNRDCQLLREGDEQWQWADSLYPELAEEDVASADESDSAESSDEPYDADEDEPAPAPPASAPNEKKSKSKAASATSSESSSAAKSAGKKTVAKQERGSPTSATATKRSARAGDDDWPDDEQLSDRSRITAGLLGIFLGPLGLHRIYLGYVLIGLLMLATGGGCGIWSLIDAIRVLLGHVPDASGKTLRV